MRYVHTISSCRMFQYECITGFEEVGRQDSRLRLSISGGRGEEGKRTASQDSREVCFGMLCDCLILYACRPDALYMLLEMKESGSLCTTHLGVHMRREVEGSHLGSARYVGAYTGKMVTWPNPLNLDTTGYPPCTPPPDKEKRRGRKRRRRYPSRGEDYAEGSAPTRRRSACSHCGMSGHNMRTCPERMP